MEGRAVLADRIARGRRMGDELAKRACVLAGLRRPIEPVLLVGTADDALRISGAGAADAIFVGVLVLRVDIGKAGLDRVELVAADAPIQDLKPAGGCIELPGGALARERNR